MDLDTLPYKTFLKLKEKFTVKTLRFTQKELTLSGIHLAYKTHRDFITAMFQKEGVEVYRYAHNYKSLDTSYPELGLVYLASDSVLDEAMEVHALIGHNARYISESQ